MRFVLTLLFFLIYQLSAAADDAPQLKSPHCTVTLLSDTVGYTPGEKLTLGFYFQTDPDWHVYWKNPGDSGSAPKFIFESQEELSPGEIIWPTPKRIPISHLVNYGYENEVLLPFPLRVASHASGTQVLKVHGEWLVCKEDCVPGEGDFVLTLKEENKVIPSEHIKLFSDYLTKAPMPYSKSGLSAFFAEESVTLSLPEEIRDKEIYFMPDLMGVVQNSMDQNVSLQEGRTVIDIPRARSKKEPAEVSGILTIGDEHYAASFRSAFALAEDGQGIVGFLKILLFAFVGGLILNLMPCVFPVIGIKVLSLVEESQMEGRSRTAYVISYAVGVTTSLWILFGVVLLARSLGNELGWGFQLQHPAFVAGLILLFLGLGFNFLGFIEIRTPMREKRINERHYLVESFLSGLLTTVVATPCTAPFMGTSIAYALQTDVFTGFLVFTSLGIGLACPYLFFAFFPSLLRILPRPGQWMGTFKRFLAFPLFGAAIWLLWVLGQQTGSEGVIQVLCAALVISFGIWIKHDFGSLNADKRRRFIAGVFLIASIATAFSITSRIQPVSGPTTVATYTDSYNQQWEPYTKELLERLLGSGKTVYLDLTASWCVTCQVNKAVVFGSKEVRDYVAQEGIVLVRGDWTNQDPAVSEVIQSYGKAGVPLNILFKPGRPPVIFPTVLTASQVLREMQSEK